MYISDYDSIYTYIVCCMDADIYTWYASVASNSVSTFSTFINIYTYTYTYTYTLHCD